MRSISIQDSDNMAFRYLMDLTRFKLSNRKRFNKLFDRLEKERNGFLFK